MSNATKSFDILNNQFERPSDSSNLYNYFDSLIKLLFSDLYLAKFLNTLANTLAAVLSVYIHLVTIAFRRK